MTSLQDLERSRGPLNGIVVAAGAAIGTIPETSAPLGPGCSLAICTTQRYNLAMFCEFLQLLLSFLSMLRVGSAQAFWLPAPHTAVSPCSPFKSMRWPPTL